MMITHCISGISIYTLGSSLAIGIACHIKGFYIAPFHIDRFGVINPFDMVYRQRCADARSNNKEG